MSSNLRRRLGELQARRLRRAVALGWGTPLYRRLWRRAGLARGSIRRPGDLQRLPFISKRDLSDFPGAIGRPGEVSVFHTTSGTTGSPTVVAFTRGDVEVQTGLEARNLGTVGVARGDTVFNLVPYGMFFAGGMLHEGARRVGARVVPAGRLASGAQVARLMGLFRPTVVLGIPQFLFKWAGDYREVVGDPRKSSLRLLYGLGEPLPDRVRDRLEREWGLEVRRGYGLSECGSGAECGERMGFHWPEDQTLVECINPQSGEPLGDGERGELVYTVLTRTGTLALRFRSGDISSLDHGPCPCGRTTVRIMPVEHRRDDLVKIKGALTSPYAIDEAVLSRPGVRTYLCVVDRNRRGLDEVRLYVEARESPALRRSLGERLGGGVWWSPGQVVLLPPGSLPELGRKGKRFVDLRSAGTEVFRRSRKDLRGPSGYEGDVRAFERSVEKRKSR
ncbi:MAG: AMP-binding protein [Euryarchaeota archaeon]|nr:AMP-binding protein [Euryarchaeota archaeon]